MSEREPSRAERFRALHAPGRMLVLPNAWDAGSACVIEACGAEAIATTSSGLAWACGHPDGDAIPPAVLAQAIGRIERVISVPLSVDAEGGYAQDHEQVGETVRALMDAGAVGVNLEDGSTHPPDALCAKIAAVRTVAERAGIALFVNARTDVFLRGLVSPERRVAETLARAARYRAAGCDGLFVPAVADPLDVAALVAGT